jgi:hypothetical protein
LALEAPRADFLIRPYESADRKALLQIAADTAFFGEPIEAVMDERGCALAL